MATLADRLIPTKARDSLQKHGSTANLTARRGSITYSAVGIKCTPPKQHRTIVKGTNVEQIVSTVTISAIDPKLLDVSFPDPAKGDVFILQSDGVPRSLVDSNTLYSGELKAAYQMMYQG